MDYKDNKEVPMMKKLIAVISGILAIAALAAGAKGLYKTRSYARPGTAA